MTPEQYARVRVLFDEAIDVAPDRLEAWLAARCEDEAVRREVASLLASHSRAGEFLTQPAGSLVALLDDVAQDFEVGRLVGPYRIVAEAGRGGMGRVYRAVDTRLDRTVALKSLTADQAGDPSHRERLRREARAAAALTHPGICTVHALEEIDGDLFLVTEFIEGRTLRDEIDGGVRPATAGVVETARQLAAALAAAHAAGVTHRDLKPENVMRTGDGRIKILDFGLARRLDDGAGHTPAVTAPGAVIGTPAYMAPEQLNGQAADARSDVFAFGLVVYEFATGRHPFDAPTSLARAGRVLASAPDPLGPQRPDLPAAIAAAVERCLAKAPADRFASAVELAAAIAEPRGGAPEAARPARGLPPGPVGDTGWWRTHHLVMIGLYFTLVCAAWFVKEWHHGLTSTVFIVLGIAATIAGVLRAHLVFTERTHGVGLHAERRRIGPVTMGIDLFMALTIGAEGLLVASRREVAGLLIVALAVGLALARVVLEPATTRATFPAPEA